MTKKIFRQTCLAVIVFTQKFVNFLYHFVKLTFIKNLNNFLVESILRMECISGRNNGEFWYSENDNERFKSELSALGYCWRLQRGVRGPDRAD